MTQPGKIVGAVRIDDRDGFGEFLVGLMMVDHHRVEPELLGLGQLLNAGGAAIDRDKQVYAALCETADCIDVRAVAFEDAIRNVNDGIEPATTQVTAQQRRRRRAIDIVVAKDSDTLLVNDGIGDALSRGLHLCQRVRIRHQAFDGGIEIGRNLVRLDAAPGQHPRQQLGHAVALRDRQRARLSPLVQAVAPCSTGRGLLHAEKRSRQCIGEWQRHVRF